MVLMQLLPLILFVFIYEINCQVIDCTSSSCSCPTSPSYEGTTCELQCIGDTACKERTINCRSGDRCIVTCIGIDACGGVNTMINANGATDFNLTCDGDSTACYDAQATCGTGKCLLKCLNGCGDNFRIDLSPSTQAFDCIGDHCPTNSRIPQAFTATPTTSETPYTSTVLPTSQTTYIPTVSPISSSTILSAKPTLSPSSKPTSSPSNKPTGTAITKFPKPSPSIIVKHAERGMNVTDIGNSNLDGIKDGTQGWIYVAVSCIILCCCIIVSMIWVKHRKYKTREINDNEMVTKEGHRDNMCDDMCDDMEIMSDFQTGLGNTLHVNAVDDVVEGNVDDGVVEGVHGVMVTPGMNDNV